MLNTIKSAFKVPDLRKKLLYTLLIIFVYRIGAAIPAPFVNAQGLIEATGGADSLLGFFNTFSGGAFANATIFALSITPYITSSIIMQLLQVAIPALERLAKDGGDGRAKLNKITRFVTVGIALMTATGYYFLLLNSSALTSEYTTGFTGFFVAIVIIFTFAAGASVIVWLGEQINERGIGNGISIILFANIISSGPQAFLVLFETFRTGGVNYFLVPLALIIFAAMIVFIIIMTNGERRIPVQYAKRVVGRKMYGGQSSYIPIKVSMSGVMPVIFASSFLSLPLTISTFVNPEVGSFWYNFFAVLSPTGAVYAVLYFLLIIAFNYFYVAVQYNPLEIANNIKNNNGAIPGIRPGRPTVSFISRVISKITLLGALFLGVIAVFPIIFTAVTSINISMGGTSIIILVGVALDTSRQLESQMTMRHHKGFLE